MTPAGASARAFKAIADFAVDSEGYSSSLRAIYRGEQHYVYEVAKQSKCTAVAVKVNVGADCSHTVIKLEDKISCRLN